MKKSNKQKGINWEKRVEKCINSGSLWFDKGDLKSEDCIIECKYTEGKGYRISSKVLNKLWNDALDANKIPVLTIGIKDGNDLWMLNVNISKEVC